MKKLFLFLVTMIFVAASLPLQEKYSMDEKQKTLSDFAFKKEILGLDDGYVFLGEDTLFFNLLNASPHRCWVIYKDTYRVKHKDSSLVYERYMLDQDDNPVAIDQHGMKIMQAWLLEGKLPEGDDKYFAIFKNLIENGSCFYSETGSSFHLLASRLGISKEEAQRLINDPSYFPPVFSKKTTENFRRYNPLLYQNLGKNYYKSLTPEGPDTLEFKYLKTEKIKQKDTTEIESYDGYIIVTFDSTYFRTLAGEVIPGKMIDVELKKKFP